MRSPVWQVQDGVPPSSYLLSSMFAACAAAGTQEMLEAADSSHMHMEGLWNKICSKGKTFTEEQYAWHTWLASLSCSHCSITEQTSAVLLRLAWNCCWQGKQLFHFCHSLAQLAM